MRDGLNELLLLAEEDIKWLGDAPSALKNWQVNFMNQKNQTGARVRLLIESGRRCTWRW